MKERAFDRIRRNIKPENKKFIDRNIAIIKQIKYILSIHPKIKNQKDLAKELNKEQSEISKWFTGQHNLTQETINKIELALDHDILLTDLEARAKYQSTVYMHFVDSVGYRSKIPAETLVNADSGGSQQLEFE